MRKRAGMLLSVMMIDIMVASVEAAAYSGGTGTESDPYQIGSIADWSMFSNTTADWDKHFVLIGDIDFAGASLKPVGTSSIKFLGVFDGDSHVLRNGQINKSEYYIGLFGYLGSGGTIRNLGVEAVAVTGYHAVGGLVGYNWFGTVTSCYATGTVTASNASVGGLVGVIYGGTITSCYATGMVTGNNSGVGGLVGSCDNSTITSCYATGAVTGEYNLGGLVGSNSGTITSSYATGTVTGSEGVFSTYNIGGLVGLCDEGIITSCYATGAVTGNANIGGLVGRNYGTVTGSFWNMEGSGQDSSAGGKGLTISQMGIVSYFQNAGWNAYDWVMTAGSSPRLAWEGLGWPVIPEPGSVPLAGSGTEEDPFQVETAADFAFLSWHISVLNKHVRLMADMDLAEITLYPIGDFVGPFTGVFDGNNHVLRNGQIHLPESNYIGLFACLGPGGEIRNLGVETVDVTGNHLYVGSLVGYNAGGTVTSCYATGEIMADWYSEHVGGLVGSNDEGMIASCHTTVVVTASQYSEYVGGLVGSNAEGTVTSSYAMGAVMGGGNIGGLVGSNSGTVESCYTTDTVTGRNNYIGGLVGSNSGVVMTCYTTGSVLGVQHIGGLVGSNSNTVMSCYATGVVTGDYDVGGVAGSNSGTVTSCYWDMDTSGLLWSAVGEGRTTAEMVYPYAGNTYVGWDFLTVWDDDTDHNTNNGYPYLRDQGSEGEGEPSVPHPADLNIDFRIVMSEAIAYLSGWQQGSNPIAYAIRAAYLWQNGEQYAYDAEQAPPLSWVLAP